MPKAKRLWSSLSPAYRTRLRGRGITPQAYNSGKVSLKAARGHAATPERPQRAFNRPDLFGDYLRRRLDRGEDLPPNIIREQRPEGIRARIGRPSPWTVDRILGDIGYPGQDNVTIQVIWVHPRGNVPPTNVNGMEPQRINMKLAETSDDILEPARQAYPYQEGDFRKLVGDVRSRGFVAVVESGQYEWRITA